MLAKDDFENILNGKLPDGTLVNQTANRRTGVDLTFLDAEIRQCHGLHCRRQADPRSSHDGRQIDHELGREERWLKPVNYSRSKNGEPVRTGNLVYAMFEHDTSRKLDPQGHIHVVIAAITKTAAGKWQGLWNGELWKNNTTIGSAYHAAFREQLTQSSGTKPS